MESKPLALLARGIEEFNQQYPRPAHPPITLSDLYDLSEDWPQKSWPDADRPGVYVIFDAEEGVRYIGKASCNRTLGNRLGAHFVRADDGSARCTHDWWGVPRYVATISVLPDRAFEAAALEEFLIAWVNPPLNTIARKAEAESV